MNALRAAGLTKRYARSPVVDALDLTVERGELYGFLGPNGAGKTTTIRMALGLIHPSGGEVELLGERLGTRGHVEALARTGALIEEPGFYRYLSGRRNLVNFARAGGSRPDVQARLRRVDAVMEQARKAGAVTVKEAQDTFWGGYAGYFQDPDGHLWEVVWNPDWDIT